MGENFTAEYADAADLERENDPDLGGFAIRLFRQDQTQGSPTRGKFIETARAERGFIVSPPFNISGDMYANARLYSAEGGVDGGLPEQEIERAEGFDVLDEEGAILERYTIRRKPRPLGATREYRILASPNGDRKPLAAP